MKAVAFFAHTYMIDVLPAGDDKLQAIGEQPTENNQEEHARGRSERHLHLLRLDSMNVHIVLHKRLLAH